MNLDLALRLTEILLGLALIQASLEHLRGSNRDRLLFGSRGALSICLLLGVQTGWAAIGLLGIGLFILHRFQGPYNGGSDRMGLLVTAMLALALNLPHQEWRELAFGYLALQLILSYFMSGWVKIINPDWRSGRALRDVFEFSAYPVSEDLRGLKDRANLLWMASWGVMLFELLFPLSMTSQTTLKFGLAIAASFHLANACLFGLNRFFWIWVAAFPSILWLQHRLTAGA